MSLWKVAWRSIQQRVLASGLTAFSMGLGVALVVTVLVIHGVVSQTFKRGATGYDLIIGGKGGSKLDLVLNTVFHLGDPLHNIPYQYFEDLQQGNLSNEVKLSVPLAERSMGLLQRADLVSKAVELAIPVCLGHDYQGCPAVATTPDFFEKLTYYYKGKDVHYQFREGKNFQDEKGSEYDAVLGATAARKTGLKLGDTFRPVAKSQSEYGKHEDPEFKIVGILEPTGTANDRAIFMNIEGFWRCPAHAKAAAGDAAEGSEHEEHADHEDHAGHDHTGHHHALHREVSAILVCYDKSMPQLYTALPEVVNKYTAAQAVEPSREIFRFLNGIVGNVQLLLLILAVLVVVVAGIGIMVSMYNSMSDRRHDIAIMRALGARRSTVMLIILFESILLALGGGALGVALGHGLIAVLGPTIAEQTGVVVNPWDFQPVELMLIPGLVILASLVGYLPAMYAYKTDVAKSLMAGT
ncbi:MAG: ABC transporter permease [Pirellulales bacterium]|nr:ABC transporter permease [Pirellulales bacterium]